MKNIIENVKKSVSYGIYGISMYSYISIKVY